MFALLGIVCFLRQRLRTWRAADKIPKETAGALISALIGFAFGKAVE